jgi:putative phosphoribosyl transferase
MVARKLNAHGMATLLFDLLAPEEAEDREKVFDIGLLSERLTEVLRWLNSEEELVGLPVGLFGASTGAAAALSVAARPDGGIFAVVSRGGRPDLAGDSLNRVAVPVLLLVGSRDAVVCKLNEDAISCLKGPKLLKVIPGASHLFEEPGALEEVAASAVRWFEDYSPVKKFVRV